MLRLAFWVFNIWGAKKGLDLFKENMQLKQDVKDSDATIRTLAKKFPAGEFEVEPPRLPFSKL